jgi:predicted CXXCH cytochrome family protein
MQPENRQPSLTGRNFMKWIGKHWRMPLAIGILIIIYGCVAAQEQRPADHRPDKPPAAQQSSAQPEPTGAAIYQQKIKPLSTRQCAQCHYAVYSDIRDRGGKHQVACTECHETFHTWKPGRKWSEVVPKCASCHELAHGPAFPDCLKCHTDPHAPIASLVKVAALAPKCSTCHTAEKAELSRYKSAHTEVGCTECHHSRHGYQPKCTECHDEPHTPYTDNAGCLSCHPVHSPKNIHYPATTPNQVCASCHQETADKLAHSHRKHATKPCVFCHVDKHGYVPHCTKCHQKPHSKKMLEPFKYDCKACHGEPHNLILPGHK